jgi:hypothetical protein
MVLIADCGSTKIDWCVLNGDKLEKRFFSTGVNALLMPEEKIRETFEKELAPEIFQLTKCIIMALVASRMRFAQT